MEPMDTRRVYGTVAPVPETLNHPKPKAIAILELSLAMGPLKLAIT